MLMNRLKLFLTPFLIVIAAFVMWVEEFLWKRLKALTSLIGLIPFVRRAEVAIAGLPPYAAMIVLLAPMSTLFPLKLLAIYWLAHGYWLASLGLLATAKVLGTAIVARMYVICQPQLMTITWFRSLRDMVILTRDWLYQAVQQLPVYQSARQLLLSFKDSARNLLSSIRSNGRLWQRWRAIRRWRRQNATK